MTYTATNTVGNLRYTETLTDRCTMCDRITTTECDCGRCLDMFPFNQTDSFGNLI
tara:strand:+ start:389 stop:553 length:165 start_codon:yes stop_codon:yes gene_type:complete